MGRLLPFQDVLQEHQQANKGSDLEDEFCVNVDDIEIVDPSAALFRNGGEKLMRVIKEILLVVLVGGAIKEI